jgi:hypothetical protein
MVCGHSPTVDYWPAQVLSSLRPAPTGVRHHTNGGQLVSPVACMIVLLHAIHAPHTHAAKALPELVITLAYGYTPHIAPISSIALAAFAATSRAPAPSVGTHVAAKVPVALQNILETIGSHRGKPDVLYRVQDYPLVYCPVPMPCAALSTESRRMSPLLCSVVRQPIVK